MVCDIESLFNPSPKELALEHPLEELDTVELLRKKLPVFIVEGDFKPAHLEYVLPEILPLLIVPFALLKALHSK